MRVVFAGGGTGGHIYPGVAAARALLAIDDSISVEFWGSGRPLETEILAKEGFPARHIPSAPLPSSPLGAPHFFYCLAAGLYSSYRLEKSLDVRAVVGLGGFSSYAPVRVATLRGLPTFLLEQNAIPGRANRRLARTVTAVLLSLPGSERHFPASVSTRVTGNPLRLPIIQAAAACEYDPSGGILILGGSTGAIGLNTLVTASARSLSALGRPITHQAGKLDFERVRAAYLDAGVTADVVEYIDDMPAAYRRAALVIARAGGTTISELSLFGLPAILVPYPHHKDRHQAENAQLLVDAASARIIEQTAGAAELADVAKSLLRDAPGLLQMHNAARRLAHPEAAETVASIIYSSICECGFEAARKTKGS